MEYIITAVAILILAAFFGMSRGNADTEKPVSKGKPVVVSEKDSMKQSEIADRLAKLAKDPPPTELSRGAMCYSTAIRLPKDEYICPKCGEKTLYTAEEGPRAGDKTSPVRMEIPSCRRLIEQIKGLDIELDESQFCAKCTPDLKEPPKICLVVHYKGVEKPHRVEGITTKDLVLINEFLSGSDKHQGDFGVETPLKNYIDRLEQLLGVEIEEKKVK